MAMAFVKPTTSIKFNAAEALAAVRAIYATSIGHTPQWERAVRFVECTNIVPPWIYDYKPNQWVVMTAEGPQETFAASERDAINNVRFRLYDTTPEEQCETFTAICPHSIIMDAVSKVRGIAIEADREARTTHDLFGAHTMSKADAMRRLAKMHARH